jgi:hypothetical protein
MKKFVVASLICFLGACHQPVVKPVVAHKPPAPKVAKTPLTEEDLMFLVVELNKQCIDDNDGEAALAFCECASRSVIDNIRMMNITTVEDLVPNKPILFPNEAQLHACKKEALKSK